MPMRPIVTVIIPTFNRCQYLKQAVDSVLEQTYPNVEIIVADNASTDNTTGLMASYVQSRNVKYYRNETNIGMYPNWKKALREYATGTWILLLSDDDFLVAPDYLEKAIAIVENSPSIVAVFSNYCQYNETTRKRREFRKSLPPVSSGKDIFLNWNKFQALPSTVVFNSAKAKELGFFSNSDILSCDWADFLRLVLHGDVGFLPDCVVAYRVHPENASRQPQDLSTGFKNLGYIKIAKEHAVSISAFPGSVIMSWERRMMDMHCSAIFGQISMDNPVLLRQLAGHIGYPQLIRYLFLYPRNMAKLFIGVMRKIYTLFCG